MNYYVLGIKDNPMLKEYLDKYYDLLISMLKEISDLGILEDYIKPLLKIENKDFILNADQSSIINLLYRELVLGETQGLGDYKIHENKLKKEIKLFLEKKYDELIMNKGKKIHGTNIKLTSIDNNPYNIFDSHPEHKQSGGIMGWGSSTEENWLKTYEKTFTLLKKLDEGIYDELNQIITKIVPLGTSKGIHNSASYKESVGHLYMGYTIDVNRPEINNLEAIIHESSHNKLNLLSQFDPLILNDKSEKYYSAIRPDARHIHGVFLGYHAFAPTMYIIMKAYKNGFLGEDKGWFEKIVLYHIKTKLLQRVIKKYAILTQLGKEISAEIDLVISKMDKLIKELNPSKEIIKLAEKKQKQHFREVLHNCRYLEY